MLISIKGDFRTIGFPARRCEEHPDIPHRRLLGRKCLELIDRSLQVVGCQEIYRPSIALDYVALVDRVDELPGRWPRNLSFCLSRLSCPSNGSCRTWRADVTEHLVPLAIFIVR